MRMSVNALIAPLLLALPTVWAQETGSETPTSQPRLDSSKTDLRKKTRFRVVDRQGKPWIDARIVAYSRPGDGIVDRVEGQSAKRGRASLQLLPGRAYVAWAWSPVEKSASGEYRISGLNLRVGVGGIITLREASNTRLRIQIELQGTDRWKGPLTAKLIGYLSSPSRQYFSFDIPVQGNQLTMPVSPIHSASIYVFDAGGCMVASSKFNCSKAGQQNLLQVAEARRKKTREAEEAKREKEEVKRKKEEAEAKREKKDPSTKKDPVAKKEPEAKKDPVAKKKQEAKRVVLVRQFQIAKLGPLIQGINVNVNAGRSNLYLDYVSLGKVKWRVYPPYYFRVKIEDKDTKAPVAHARIFKVLYDISYELGKTDEKGMATLTMAMRLNEKTGRPMSHGLNFRVHAKGYPETSVQRYNLKLPAFKKLEELESKDSKPQLVSKLSKGFGVKGRVFLSEGKPLAAAALLIRSGMVYDYGNRNHGMNQNGPTYVIRTDAEGRFEWPCCDERFVLSISAILDPETLAQLGGDDRFSPSARVVLYQDRGKGAPGANMIIGGAGGVFGVPAPAKKKKKDDKKGDKKPVKPEKPVIRDLGDLRIDKLSSVRVQVVQTDGTPTAHARIGLASKKSGQNYYSPPLHLSNHLGRLRVMVPGEDDYVLGAGIEGQALLLKLILPAKEPILLQLVSGLVLKGRIVDPNGDPLEGANVYLYPYGGVKVLHQGLWKGLRGGNTTTKSKADGTFELPILADSTYSFMVNYLYKKQQYNLNQQIVDTESSSEDLGDLEIPLPVPRKDKKKEAASKPSK